MHANKPEMAKKWEKEKNEMKKMQIKGSELKQIVQEELDNLMLDEGWKDLFKFGRSSSAGSGTDKPETPPLQIRGSTGKDLTGTSLGQELVDQGISTKKDFNKRLGGPDWGPTIRGAAALQARSKEFYGDKPGAQKAHSAAMKDYHSAGPERGTKAWEADPYGDRAKFGATNRSRTARGKDLRQWGDTSAGKFQGRMGFGMGSKGHDQYTQDMMTTTGGAYGDEDPRTADPEGYAQALARREQYASGGGGYGQAAGFQPALGGRNVFQKAGAAIRGRGFRESTQIKGSELKQIVQEELTKLVKEGGMMGHYMPNLVSASGDTPEDIAKQLLESGQEITDELATQAAMDAGVLDDDLPDFVDAIMETLQDEGWESQIWQDASAQRGTQRPPHRPRMTNVEKAPESAAWKRRKAMHASEMARHKGEK
jgi:hypothetical protein